MDAIQALQTALYGPQGFTLLGALIAFGILSLILALAQCRSIYALPRQTRIWRKSVSAKVLPNTGNWFNGHALNAQATVDGNGDPLVLPSPSGNLALRWTKGDGVQHSSTYAVSGNSIDRQYDGRTNTPAGHVAADTTGLLHCGNFLTLGLEREPEPGNPQKPVLWTYLRKKE